MSGLDQVESQPKPNSNMKYMNSNTRQPNFQSIELNLNRNYETRVKFELIRLIKVKVKMDRVDLRNLLNYKTI